MTEFKEYMRVAVAHLRPYVEGEDLSNISISPADLEAGSPKAGDMIARNPDNHQDQWLVAKEYFEKNFADVDSAVLVPKAEYNRLKDVDVKMDYLDAAGIDNTEAYNYAMEQYHEDHPDA